MVELKNVSFTYGEAESDVLYNTGVYDISLNIARGRCVVLCGRSGSGKSTLLRLIGGLAPGFFPGELAGEVLLDGKEAAGLSSDERAKMLGMVFQDPRSQFFMDNVLDELAFTADNLGMPPKETKALLERQAEKLHIAHLLDQNLSDLSSGQKQRVAIAAASLLLPSVMLLDEPTANLDEKSTAELLDILTRLKNSGITLIVSEHRLQTFLPVADQYVCMDAGRIAQLWSPTEFRSLTTEQIRPYGLRHPRMQMDCASVSECSNENLCLECRSIGYRYRNGDGIENVTLRFPQGSVTALTGENGAGKTTLCKVLCGLMRPKQGTVLLCGRRQSRSALRVTSHFVMQDADYQLYTDSVGNELLLGKKVTEESKMRAFEALDAFGLREVKDRHPASLSGGQKQRVVLAAAYCSDAQLIVLDEPTSGQDGDNLLKTAVWIRKLAQEGRTVIVITHDKLLESLVCDRCVQMEKEEENNR